MSALQPLFEQRNPRLERRRREALRASLKRRFAATRPLSPWSAPQVVEVPTWVMKADLVDDFLDVFDERGELAAAAHCRRLKAQVQQ